MDNPPPPKVDEFLPVDSPFFSAIVLFNPAAISPGFGWFSR